MCLVDQKHKLKDFIHKVDNSLFYHNASLISSMANHEKTQLHLNPVLYAKLVEHQTVDIKY